MFKKKKIWITILCVFVLLFTGICGFAGNYLVNYALMVEEDGHIGSMGDDVYTGIQDTPAQAVYDEWVKTIDLQEWIITSNDGLKLWAQFYPSSSDSHQYVLAVHGYTVDHRDIMPSAVPFANQGYHILAIDQRGRGNSEGSYLSMGWLEKNDVLLWIQEIIRRDPDAQIILYGESMGAATLMMAAGEELPDNVKVLIEDCGYTSAYAMFKDQLKERFGLPEYPFLPAANIVCYLKTGFAFTSASAINQLKKATLPILFIHGAADDYVPTYMGEELYESYQGPKELLLIEGAGHGQSADVDPDTYYQTIFNFIEKYR